MNFHSHSSEPAEVTRRRFLQAVSAASAASALWPLAARPAWAADGESAAQLIAGKDARMIVHSSRPLEIETPLALLRQHELTPKSLMFVRNNQAIPNSATTEPAAHDDWTIELKGLLLKARGITVEELAKMDQVRHVVVVQCSGNGRAIFSKTAPAEGSQWECGAMANVEFAGVPLKAIVEKLELKISPQARFLAAEGKDSPAPGDVADFEHSIPLDDALDRAFLALSMNGEPIPRVHGGPVRLIIPGYYGTMFVKWLGALRFEANETSNHHQVRRYRTPRKPIEPGSKFNYAIDNSDPNWQMRIKSVIFAPLAGDKVEAGMVEVRGVAFNDGTAKITAVLVSTDDGRTWRKARLTEPNGPYAWCPWSIDVDLTRGKHTLMARAIDAQGRTQPIDPAPQWNPAGYAFSAVHRVEVEVV